VTFVGVDLHKRSITACVMETHGEQRKVVLLLIEDVADRCVLAYPKKLRVIAESKNKSDRIAAFVLAEFLLLDIVPEAWRPTPRVQRHCCGGRWPKRPGVWWANRRAGELCSTAWSAARVTTRRRSSAWPVICCA